MERVSSGSHLAGVTKRGVSPSVPAKPPPRCAQGDGDPPGAATTPSGLVSRLARSVQTRNTKVRPSCLRPITFPPK